jgi:zinc D-Ala-D-Ala carboxypeptidase
MKHFHIREFDCTHTGTGGENMDPEFLENLDRLREICGFPFRITSGWRDATHPVEARKEKPGTHNLGIAVDIAVSNGFERMNIVHEALKMGFSGIGVAKGFVHVDMRTTTPVMWTYG